MIAAGINNKCARHLHGSLGLVAFLGWPATFDRLSSRPLLDVLGEPDWSHREFGSWGWKFGSGHVAARGALADAEEFSDFGKADDVQ